MVMNKWTDWGFIICTFMVGLAIVRPASGIDPAANFEMLVYGLIGVIACLWRDSKKDKRDREDEESHYLIDTYYQMQDYKKRNRE
jgi:hypothetical protein